MLKEVFRELDSAIDHYNKDARRDRFAGIQKSEFHVLGQTALLEAKLDLELRATQDVDAYVKAHHWVINRFNELLLLRGRHYDIHSGETWMPDETKYKLLFSSVNLQAFIAEPQFIMLSKAIKAPQKNRELLAQYIHKEATDEFFKLALKYNLDVERILK